MKKTYISPVSLSLDLVNRDSLLLIASPGVGTGTGSGAGNKDYDSNIGIDAPAFNNSFEHPFQDDTFK